MTAMYPDYFFSGPIVASGFVISLLCIVALWVVFQKAGEAGWKSIIPVYNSIVLLRIVGMNPWWVLSFLVPILGQVIAIMAYIKLAYCFSKSAWYAVGLIFLPFVFLPLLAFGQATYHPLPKTY